MFQLRGLGDCTATPNDPVCLAFYGSTPTPPSQTAVLQTSQWAVNHAWSANASTPVITQNPTPGTTVNLLTESSPWYTSWWGIGLLLIAGIGAWQYTKKRKTV